MQSSGLNTKSEEAEPFGGRNDSIELLARMQDSESQTYEQLQELVQASASSPMTTESVEEQKMQVRRGLKDRIT